MQRQINPVYPHEGVWLPSILTSFGKWKDTAVRLERETRRKFRAAFKKQTFTRIFNLFLMSFQLDSDLTAVNTVSGPATARGGRCVQEHSAEVFLKPAADQHILD